MEIKNVRVNEIHWSIGWNASQEANKRLKDKIGETSKYFAQLKVGNATYNWIVDTVGKWRPMGMAPDSDKGAIMEKTEEIRQEVFDKLSGDDSLATKICQVPNYEEYIFYKDNADGTIDVVITGWGFHNFKKSGPFVETWPPRPVMHNTTISFVIDGERQPQRTFSVVTPKMQKPDVTDDLGVRTYREYAGVNITVIDDATQKQFSFTTEDKDTELEFDITKKTAVIIRATMDGESIMNETVSVDYDGKHYDVSLINGEGKLTDLSFKEGISCVATMRGEQRSEPLSADADTVISFDFTTPPPVVEKCDITVVATLDGNPLAGETISIDYAGQHYDLTLDNAGKATICDIVCTGDVCHASMRDTEHSITPERDKDNIISFELLTPAKEPIMATISVLNAQGQPMKNANFRLVQGEQVQEGVLDEQGTAQFVMDNYTVEQPLQAHITTEDQRQIEPIEFTLEDEEKEYVLQENAPKSGGSMIGFLVGLLILAALAAGVIFGLKPGVEELTKIINKNFF